jgi:acetyl esterase/lipase
MSLRAELVRLGLRWFVKRKIGPAVTLEALRRQDAFLARLVPPPPKGTQATHVDLDGVKAVAVVTPASHGGRLVLYLHGGGHVSGSPALYGDFTWRIAAAARARTVILDHRLAPEHPFPAALDDAVTAYRALVADGADPRRMAVLGESSGGGLVLAMLLNGNLCRLVSLNCFCWPELWSRQRLGPLPCRTHGGSGRLLSPKQRRLASTSAMP